MRSLIAHIVCLLILSSCFVEDEYSFVSDPFDPRVPQYTEEGANTAGAYINSEPWVCKKRTVSSIFAPTPTTVGTMTLYHSSEPQGTFIAFEQGDILLEPSDQNCSVGFFLNGVDLNGPNGIYQLENKRIELDGVENFGRIVRRNDFHEIDNEERGVGILYVRRIDRFGSNHLFMSGTFGFSVTEEDQETTVFSGRFDYEVFPEQFQEF
jgi:hypothetical protein